MLLSSVAKFHTLLLLLSVSGDGGVLSAGGKCSVSRCPRYSIFIFTLVRKQHQWSGPWQSYPSHSGTGYRNVTFHHRNCHIRDYRPFRMELTLPAISVGTDDIFTEFAPRSAMFCSVHASYSASLLVLRADLREK